MPALVLCSCGEPLTVPDELAGSPVRCPLCQAVLTAGVGPPSPAGPPAPPTSPTPSCEEGITKPPATPPDPATWETLLPDLPEIPGYEVLGELGRGGMGVVYAARQTGLGRLVALKMNLTLEGQRAPGEAPFRGVCFSPDGKRLASDLAAALPREDARLRSSWHRREAARNEHTGHWFAAAFHLRQLIAAKEPDADKLEERLRRCQDMLQQP